MRKLAKNTKNIKTKKAEIKKPKETLVTYEFLMNLAKKIYDPKTRRFLQLCHGSLSHFEKDTRRWLHCGIGELYYAMTGRRSGSLKEDAILTMAVQRSCLQTPTLKEIASVINGLNISHDAKVSIINDFSDYDDCDLRSKDANKFYDLLQKVANENDESSDYLSRAKAVAAQFRIAAKFLKSHENKKSRKK